MKLFYRKLATVLSTIVILTSTILPAHASDDTLILELNIGSDIMFVNGTSVQVEKPYNMDGTVYLPMTPVFETFGAEILMKDSNVYELIYRDVFLELKPGQNSYYANQVRKEINHRIRQGLNGLMIPIELISDNFDVKTEYDQEKGCIKLIMEDDGALSDLSFLTDSIDRTMAGNSYFNWAVNVPAGSRVYDSSFNSKYVCIDNEDRQILLEVNIMQAQGKTLEEFCNDALVNYDAYFDNEPEDWSLNLKGQLPYGQFLCTNLADEAAVERFYYCNDRIYSVSLTNYAETNPSAITGSSYLMSLIDSFRLDYYGDDEMVQDLSNIEFGLAKYDSTVSFDRINLYTLWEMDALPEWDIVDPSYIDPLNTTLGTGRKEYINVAVSDAEGITDIVKYGRGIQAAYSKYYRSDLYNLISFRESHLNEYKCFNIKFDIVLGNNKYYINENFFTYNGLLYDITVKIPEESYEEKSTVYDNILSSFKTADFDETAFKTDMKNYNSSYGSQKAGTSDIKVLFQNRTYNWHLSIPGYWEKEATYDKSYQIFSNPYTGASISVEAVPALDDINTGNFEDEFSILGGLSAYYDMTEIKDEKVVFNNIDTREITYRIDSDEEQVFGEVKCRILTKDDYSYCYISAVDDFASSQASLDELNSIWHSFGIGE